MKSWIQQLLTAVFMVSSKRQKPKHDVIEKRESAYKAELVLLLRYLEAVLVETVYCTIEEDFRVARIHTRSENIAWINVYPKGTNRRMTYVTVRIQDNHRDTCVWFRSAFIGYKISFLQTTLTLSRSAVQVPRER